MFLTWHLHGSLPRGLYPPPQKASSGQAFVWLDRQLDMASTGPRFLQHAAVAQIVKNGLYRGEELGHYHLHIWVIMPNHVHTLLTPRIHPTQSIASLKGATAREANKLLGRTGQPFWQAESYDRCVHKDDEFGRISAYIENNPVRAGLVKMPAAFRWSSAYERPDESGRGGQSGRATS